MAANTTNDTQLISSISAEKLVVKDIFCDDYLFTIPNYQRPYSWEEEHCTQLLDDLHSFAYAIYSLDMFEPDGDAEAYRRLFLRAKNK